MFSIGVSNIRCVPSFSTGTGVSNNMPVISQLVPVQGSVTIYLVACTGSPDNGVTVIPGKMVSARFVFVYDSMIPDMVGLSEKIGACGIAGVACAVGDQGVNVSLNPNCEEHKSVAVFMKSTLGSYVPIGMTGYAGAIVIRRTMIEQLIDRGRADVPEENRAPVACFMTEHPVVSIMLKDRNNRQYLYHISVPPCFCMTPKSVSDEINKNLRSHVKATKNPIIALVYNPDLGTLVYDVEVKYRSAETAIKIWVTPDLGDDMEPKITSGCHGRVKSVGNIRLSALVGEPLYGMGKELIYDRYRDAVDLEPIWIDRRGLANGLIEVESIEPVRSVTPVKVKKRAYQDKEICGFPSLPPLPSLTEYQQLSPPTPTPRPSKRACVDPLSVRYGDDWVENKGYFNLDWLDEDHDVLAGMPTLPPLPSLF